MKESVDKMYLERLIKGMMVGEICRLSYLKELAIYKAKEEEFIVSLYKIKEVITCYSKEEAIKVIRRILAEQNIKEV